MNISAILVSATIANTMNIVQIYQEICEQIIKVSSTGKNSIMWPCCACGEVVDNIFQVHKAKNVVLNAIQQCKPIWKATDIAACIFRLCRLDDHVHCKIKLYVNFKF